MVKVIGAPKADCMLAAEILVASLASEAPSLWIAAALSFLLTALGLRASGIVTVRVG